MSTLKTLPKPEIVEKHELLRENLNAKISSQIPKGNKDEIDKITAILLKEDEAQIFSFLTNENILKTKICEVDSNRKLMSECIPDTDIHVDEDSIPDILFEEVQAIEGEKCCQITGMILELGSDNVRGLLLDKEKLKLAVKKAKAAIELDKRERSNQGQESSDLEEKEVIGEEVFLEAEKLYPNYADRITGMLLEMEVGQLKETIQNRTLLNQCMDKAYGALTGKS